MRSQTPLHLGVSIMFKYTLRTRLLILILLVATIPLAFLAYSGYSNTRKFIIEKEEEKISFFFNDVQAIMIKFFKTTNTDISFLKEITEERVSLSNQDIGGINKGELKNIYYHFSKNNIKYDEIGFINKEGYEIIRINNNGSVDIVSEEKLQYRGDHHYIKESHSLGKGEIYTSSIDLNRKRGERKNPLKPMVRYVAPIYTEENLKGFLVLNLNIQCLLNSINEVMYVDNYENMILIDSKGHYLLHPDDNKEWSNQLNPHAEENFKKDCPEIFDEILLSKDLGIKSNGHNMMAWYNVELEDFGNKKITMFMEIEKSDYLQPLIRFRNLFMYQVIISILVLIIGVITISSYLTRPIIKIVKAVESIGKGHFDVALEIDTGDELELLGYEIKKMSYELKHTYKNMEKLVNERTRELRRAHLELQEMATKDSLTGLYNRHYFNQYIHNVDKENIPLNLMILIIDVDKFKFINDNYGHNIGDIVLKDVAKILKDSARGSDITVRYGGDEFLVVLYNSKRELAEKYIERVKKSLDKWNNKNNMLEHELTLSIGYDEYNSDKHILESINNADKMMYENKMSKRKKEQE